MCAARALSLRFAPVEGRAIRVPEVTVVGTTPLTSREVDGGTRVGIRAEGRASGAGATIRNWHLAAAPVDRPRCPALARP